MCQQKTKRERKEIIGVHYTHVLEKVHGILPWEVKAGLGRENSGCRSHVLRGRGVECSEVPWR